MKKFIIVLIVIILVLFLGIFIGKTLLSQNSNQSNIGTLSSESLTLGEFIPQDIKKIKITIISDGTENNNYNDVIYYLTDTTQIHSFIDVYNSINLQNSDNSNVSELLYEIDFNGDTSSNFKIYSNKLISVNYNNIENTFNLSNETFDKIAKSTNVKYYLHDSTLDIPSSTSCYNVQSMILSNLSQSEISSLRNDIRNIHFSLEFFLVDYINVLKDSNASFWEPATINETYIDANGTKVQSFGFWEDRDDLKHVLNPNINDRAKEIINDIILHLQYGMDNHDLSECFEAHKILHDFDYWCINYPAGNFSSKPIDWGGIHCYFGLLENYNLL